jgi:hypothetical protein
MAKKKTEGKGHKGAKKGPQRGTGAIRLAEHPRARRQIGVAKSYAGLGAFLFAGYASYSSGAPFLDVATRSLMWGLAAYVLVWALAVQVWRQLAIAEVRAAEKKWEERKAAEEDQIRKLSAILEDNGMPTTGTGAMPPM